MHRWIDGACRKFEACILNFQALGWVFVQPDRASGGTWVGDQVSRVGCGGPHSHDTCFKWAAGAFELDFKTDSATVQMQERARRTSFTHENRQGGASAGLLTVRLRSPPSRCRRVKLAEPRPKYRCWEFTTQLRWND